MTTSIKVKFKASAADNRQGRLYYQIICDRVVRQISTNRQLRAAEWDEKGETIVARTADEVRRRHLERVQQQTDWDTARLRRVVARLHRQGMRFSADDIVAEFRRLTARCSLTGLMQQLIAQYRANRQLRTAETYATTLNSFMRFSNGEDMPLDGIDARLVQQYESWLLHVAGVTPNTSSFYLRKLRAAYNHAVESGLADQCSPFKNVYTGKDKTPKRAVPLATIREVKELDLSATPGLELARDMFMFSFYTRGMSFIDMAYLTESNLQAGHIVYRRHKTGQQLTIKLEACMEEILNKYKNPATGFLLPLITSSNNTRQQYQRAQYRINYGLKRLSQQAGISPALTMYVARHSWASIALAKRIPASTISEGMGHDSEQTTRIYLASLDASAVDRANRRILASLRVS